MTAFWRDVRFGFANAEQEAGIYNRHCATLALGIALTTAIFTVV